MIACRQPPVVGYKYLVSLKVGTLNVTQTTRMIC